MLYGYHSDERQEPAGKLLDQNLLVDGNPYPPIERSAFNSKLNQFKHWTRGDMRGLAPMPENRTIIKNIFRIIVEFYATQGATRRITVTGDDDEAFHTQQVIRHTASQLIRNLVTYGFSPLLVEDDHLYVPNPIHSYPVSDGSYVIVTPVATRQGAVSHVIIKRIFEDEHITMERRNASGSSIGSLIGIEEDARGVVFHISTEGLFGESVVAQVATLVREILNRESKLSRALDKQAAPHLVLPAALVEKIRAMPETYALSETGSYIGANEGDTTEYLTWNGNFDEQRRSTDEMFIHCLIQAAISPILISPALFSSSATLGGLASGTALRRLASTTAERIEFYQSLIHNPIVYAINTAVENYSSLNGQKANTLRYRDLDWGDALTFPADSQSAEAD